MFTGRSDGPPPSPSTSSQRSDGPASALSPGSIDRVFPIRSAVSIDPNATPMSRQESTDGFPGLRLDDSSIASRREASRSTRNHSNSPPRRADSPRPQRSSISQNAPVRRPSQAETDRRTSASGFIRGDQQINILSDDASVKSDHTSYSGPASRASKAPSLAPEEGILTARFKHVVTDGGHAVITGRDGETLQRCEDEPIHIPGAIQSFGLLLAFKEEDGKLVVRTVSENSAKIIGYTPTQLFALDNFLDIFSEEQADNLLDHLDFIRDEDAADVTINGPAIFMLSILPSQAGNRKIV